MAVLTTAPRDTGVANLGGDARALPLADRSVDIVICSQVLHHFFDGETAQVLRELDRVARLRVIVADLQRSRLAAAGIWLASFLLAFHPVSRHDGSYPSCAASVPRSSARSSARRSAGTAKSTPTAASGSRPRGPRSDASL